MSIFYLPYNTQPGGVSVLKDKKGQTEPITTTDEGYSEVFTPSPPEPVLHLLHHRR